MYVYGISLSPKDSTVYFTDVLILQNAKVNKQTGFLVDRNHLSSQLKNHMAAIGEKDRTSAIVFNTKLSSITKDYDKQKARYQKNNYIVKSVDQTEFRFQNID